METYLWWKKDLVVTDLLVILVLTSKILNERWVLILYQAPQTSHAHHQLVSYKFPALKKVDDVLGGQEAWKNVDSTEGNDLRVHTCKLNV